MKSYIHNQTDIYTPSDEHSTTIEKNHLLDLDDPDKHNLSLCDLRFNTLRQRGIDLDSPRTSTSQILGVLKTCNHLGEALDCDDRNMLTDILDKSYTNLKESYSCIDWDSLAPEGKVYDFVNLYQQGIDRLAYHVNNIKLILDGPSQFPIRKDQFKKAENYASLLHNMDFGIYLKENYDSSQ